jgi:ribosome recycling factor
VDAYGSLVPLAQVGTINVPEARLLTVHVWDKGLVKMVEKAIRDAGLGLNPAADGQLIRIPIPDLNEQRRQELAKIASKYAEDARISVRNARREGMDMLKKLEKDGEISEDEHHRLSTSVQHLTDEHIKKVDELLATKQKEITHI